MLFERIGSLLNKAMDNLHELRDVPAGVVKKETAEGTQIIRAAPEHT